MKLCSFAALAVLCLGAAAGQAQDLDETLPMPPAISLGELEPTPEMWFYQEAMRRYQDPKVAVREKAAFAAQQRQRRIESRRWFGVSNSRPSANSTPLTSRYAAGWVSGNWQRYDWAGTGNTVFAIRPGNFGGRY